MKTPLSRSLSLRILLPVLGVQLLVFTLGGLLLDRAMKGYAQAHFQQHLAPLEALINTTLAPPLFSEDIGALKQRTLEIVDRTPLLAWLVVDDADDRPVARAGPAPDREQDRTRDLGQALAAGVYHTDFPVTLAGEEVGHAHIGVRLDTLRDYLARQERTLAGIGLATLAATGLLTGLLVWWRTRQLRELGEAAEAVTRGEMPPRLAARHGDEIGQLARSFNEMAGAIEDRTRAYEHERRQLQASEARQQELLVQSQRQQARFRALLSAMNLGILFETPDRRIEYVNPAFVEMWALDPELDLVGRPVAEVLEHSRHVFSRPMHSSRHVLQVEHTHEISEQFEIQLADGRILTQVSYPVHDEETRAIGRLWLYEDVTNERQTAEQLIYLAERDSLTGLYNRHRFQLEMERMIGMSQRFGHRFALLYFDLDEFKFVNDTYGHREGDTVLTRIAGELGQVVRKNDVLARLGGDEFAVVTLIDSDLEEVYQLAQRIVGAVARIPFRFRNQNIRITTSVGISIYPDLAADIETLVAQADAAMYQAKAQGKNTWSMYDRERDATSTMMAHMTWAQRIEHGLENDLFELHFQGVYRVSDRSLRHLEALVRLSDADTPGKLYMPGQFIPIAEKSGKILAIDQWVLRQVIALLARHPEMPPVAVNISGRSFDDPSLPQRIRQWLSEGGVDPGRLLVELTETAAVSDIQDAQRFIEALHQAGCTVCLDDFGAGFSSFAYLKHIAADVLKIDGQFIHDLPNNPENQIFLRAMLDVATGLHKTTVAEFVDSEAVFDMLGDFGIDLAQGYYLDKPRPDHPAIPDDAGS